MQLIQAAELIASTLHHLNEFNQATEWIHSEDFTPSLILFESMNGSNPGIRIQSIFLTVPKGQK